MNTEGRVQLGRAAVAPPGEAREDWKIVRALSEAVGQKLPYDTLDDVRRHLCETAPHFARVDQVTRAPWGNFGQAGPVDGAPFAPAVADFYLNNPVSRASATMAACSALASETRKKHG